MFKNRFVNLSLSILWIFTIIALFYREYAGGGFEKLDISGLLVEEKTYWYEIYREEKKIGFSSYTIEKIGDELIFKNERYIRILEDSAEILESTKGVANSSYTPKHLEYSAEKGKERVTIRADIDRDDIIFFVEMPDKRFTKRLSIHGQQFYLPVMLMPVIHEATMKSKDQPLRKAFSVPVLDIKRLEIVNIKGSLEEIIPAKSGIDVLSVFKYRIGDSTFFVNENGIIVKEAHPEDMVYYLSNKDWASLFDITPVEIFDYTNLKPLKADKLITNPEDLNLFEVKIDGFIPDRELYENTPISFRGTTITIQKKELQETYSLPSQDERLKKYLLSDEWIKSEDEALKRTAQIYARSYNHDALSLGRYLISYLFNLFTTQPEFIIRDSGYLVNYRYGDFIERSLMYATYARAGGLPTRLVGGLVYRNGYFFFHVWPEIWLKSWLPVDPSMYQFPADVTHIPLVTGKIEEILALSRRLEGLSIKIISFR